MGARILRYTKKTAIGLLEVMAVLLLILAIVAGIFAWRITSGPVDVSFAKPYIENALRDPESDVEILFGSVVVHWPDITQALYLRLEDITLNKNNKNVAEIGALDLSLSRRHLLIGQIKPVQIVLDRPVLHLIRTKYNNIVLFFDEDAQQDIENTAPDEVMDKAEIAQLLDDVLAPVSENNTAPSFLKALDVFEVKDAQAVVEDHVIGMTWYLPNIDVAIARDQMGLIASTSIELPGAGGVDGASNIQADIRYGKEDKMFDARFYAQDFNPHFLSEKIEGLEFLNEHFVSFNGDVRLTLSQELELQTAEALISSNAGILKLDGVYDEPFRYQSAFFDIFYDHPEKFLDIRKASIMAGDTEIIVQSPLRYNDNNIATSIIVTIPEIQMDHVPEIWPKPLLEGDPAEEWMLEKLSDGRILDMQVTLDILAEKMAGENGESEWKVEPGNLTGSFTAQNMTVDYRAPLRPITKANGRGILAEDVLTINVDDAMLGDLAVKNSTVAIDHLIAEGEGNATIDMNLNGPIGSVFKYLEDEPINKSAADIGIDGDAVKGNADLNVKVSFPTIKDLPAEDVKVTAAGTLTDTVLPGVVRGLNLTGGPLQLALGDGSVSLQGKAKLDGRPVDLKWQEYLESEGKPHSSRVEAKLVADKKLRDHFGIGLEDWLIGDIPLDIVYTEYQDDRAVIDIKGDLKQAVLMVEPFNYTKQIGATGSFSCTAIAQGPYMKEIKNLTVHTKELDLKNGHLEFETIKGESVLRRGTIDSVKLEENDLAIEFEIGTSDLLKMDITGSFLDARPFLAEKGKKEDDAGDKDPLIVSVAVDRMRTADARLIEKAKLYIDLDRKGAMNQLEMDAVAGKGVIYLRYKPDRNGIMTIRLEAGDAGATLRAFDIYDNVKGGKLVIEGQAKVADTKNVLNGTVKLGEFRVTDAPVLARILGIMGPTAIPQLLSSDGLYFSRLESKFEWHIRPFGDLYIVKDGRTSGSSLGLTFEGTIDKRKDEMALKGTVVPVSMLNNMVSEIPIIGNVLAGGKDGALIAATYKVEGPAKEPKISVNPLAALAPGFLRKLLFED